MEGYFYNNPQGNIMLSITIRFLTGVAIVLSATQSAQAGPYGSLGFSIDDIQPEDEFESFTGTGINARLGYNFGRYFGLEAEGQIGLSGEGDNPYFIDGTLIQNETYKYRGDWSVYLRPQIPVSDKLRLSLRAGFGNKYFDQKVDNLDLPPENPAFLINSKPSLGHLAYGGGIEYWFGEVGKDSIRLDFTRRGHLGSLSDGEDEPFEDSRVTVSYARSF